MPLIWKKDCLRTFIWEVWWNRDNGSNLHAGSWSLAKTQAQNVNWATSQDTTVETIMLPSVLTQSFLYIVPNTSKYLEIHSKGGPEVRPYPHAAVRMCIFWYQDTSELLRLNQHTDIKFQSQSMSLWLRRKALGATSLKAGEETRRNEKKQEETREGEGKNMKRTWESMRKHEKTLEKCQISLASELDLDPPELPAIGSGSVSRITSRPQTRQTWSLRLSVDTGSGLLSDFTLLHLA